jgi:hypothetical protein
MTMGVVLAAPPPTLSQDSLAAFDAAASRREDVLDAPPAFPTEAAQNAGFAPSVVAVPAPGSDPATPWKSVAAQWVAPSLGADAAGGFAAEWGRVMGWDQAGVGWMGGFGAEAPVRTVAGMVETYVDAPMVAAGA